MALLAVSCAAPEVQPVLSVAQIAPDRTPYDGRIVVIKGRVDERCGQLSCWLLSENGEQHLSMAYRRPFEHELRQLAGRTILLKARVDARCGSEHDGILILCTDRASEIVPLEIIQVF